MAKTSKSDDSNVIFELNGFQLKKNTLYEITEKMDSSAPDGFKEYSTTKVLSETIVDSFPGAIFDSVRGVWDTGLYDTSRAFQSSVSKDLQASVLKRLQTEIITPIEKEKGKGILDHSVSNNRYWDDFNIKVAKGTIFNTEKVDDLLKVFLLLIHYKVTPKEMESHPAYKKSMYCIVDKESLISRKAEKQMRTVKANALFHDLLKSNKNSLIQVLDYMGMRVNDSTPEASLYSMFDNFLKDDKFQNDKIFIDSVEKYETEEGQEEFYMHHKLKDWYTKNKKVKKGKDGIYMDGVYVDKDWKQAARKIQKDVELKEIFASLDV